MNNQNFKKRVAVLLAGTMALSAAPVNVFNAFAPTEVYANANFNVVTATPGTPMTPAQRAQLVSNWAARIFGATVVTPPAVRSGTQAQLENFLAHLFMMAAGLIEFPAFGVTGGATTPQEAQAEVQRLVDLQMQAAGISTHDANGVRISNTGVVEFESFTIVGGNAEFTFRIGFDGAFIENPTNPVFMEGRMAITNVNQASFPAANLQITFGNPTQAPQHTAFLLPHMTGHPLNVVAATGSISGFHGDVRNAMAAGWVNIHLPTAWQAWSQVPGNDSIALDIEISNGQWHTHMFDNNGAVPYNNLRTHFNMTGTTGHNTIGNIFNINYTNVITPTTAYAGMLNAGTDAASGAAWSFHRVSNTRGFLILNTTGGAANVDFQIPLRSLVRTTSADYGVQITRVAGLGTTAATGHINTNVTSATALTSVQSAHITVAPYNAGQHIHTLNFGLNINENSLGQFNRIGDGTNRGAMVLEAPANFTWPTAQNLANLVDVRGGDNNATQVGSTDRWAAVVNYGGNRAQQATVSFLRSPNGRNMYVFVESASTNDETSVAGQIQLRNLRLQYLGTDTRTRDISINVRNLSDVERTNRNNASPWDDVLRLAIAGGFVDGQGNATVNAGAARNILNNSTSLVIGTISDFAINMEVLSNEIPELVAGRVMAPYLSVNTSAAQPYRTARVQITETVRESWSYARDLRFYLPEGVTASHVRLINVDSGSTFPQTPVGLRGLVEENWGRAHRDNDFVTVDGNVITIRNEFTNTQFRNTNNGRVRFDMDLYLSIAADFEGDIYLTLGGHDIDNQRTNTPYAVIAEAVAPISVVATTSNIRLGYQFVSVGNFDIVENFEGALLANEEVFISITDSIFSELAVAPNFTWAVTEGNIDITNPVTPMNLTGFMHGQAQPHIVFEVRNASTEASTISFANVQVRQVMVSPLSNVGYDLVVWGPAVAQNFNSVALQQRIHGTDSVAEANNTLASQAWSLPLNTAAFFNRTVASRNGVVNPRNLFNVPGISVPYITIGQTGAAVTDQVITMSSDGAVTVGGVALTIPAGYGTAGVNANGVLTIPARLAFSLFFNTADPHDPDLFVWNPATSTFHIDPAGRNISFTTNSSVMTVGGVQRQVLTGEAPNAVATAAYVNAQTGRLMIPARAFAEALDLRVDWDAASSTATFSPRG